MNDQLSRLYESFCQIGDVEKIKNLWKFEKDQMILAKEERTKQIETMTIELNTIYNENTELKDYLKETVALKNRLQEEKEKILTYMKEKINKIEEELVNSKKSKEDLQIDYSKLEKQLQSALNEKEKLKQKIAKMKRRRNVDLNQKLCKNCGKEYLENENFNWSCRTHRSEYGGEMWWCCGKNKKDAPGCKFAKHECKDDEEEEKDKEEDDKIKHKHIKCTCCKESGHSANECKREPNIRSLKDPMEEFERILKYQEYKKFNADTFLFTSKLFEYMAREHEREMTQNEENANTVGNNSAIGIDQAANASTSSHLIPFKGLGAMQFDDYNYSSLNKIIFKMKEQQRRKRQKSVGGGMDEEQSGEDSSNQDEENQKVYSGGQVAMKLNAQNLRDSINTDNTIAGGGANKDQNEEGQQQKKQKKLLFNEEEIEWVQSQQNADLLEDIVMIKHETAIENLKLRNLVYIEQHLDQMEKVNVLAKGLINTKGRKSLASKSQTNRQSDDDPSNIFASYSNQMINKDEESSGGKFMRQARRGSMIMTDLIEHINKQ